MVLCFAFIQDIVTEVAFKAEISCHHPRGVLT